MPLCFYKARLKFAYKSTENKLISPQLFDTNWFQTASHKGNKLPGNIGNEHTPRCTIYSELHSKTERLTKNCLSLFLNLACVFSTVSGRVALARKIYVYHTLGQQFFWPWSLTSTRSNAMFSLTSYLCWWFLIKLWPVLKLLHSVYVGTCDNHTMSITMHLLCSPRKHTQKMKIALVVPNFAGGREWGWQKSR